MHECTRLIAQKTLPINTSFVEDNIHFPFLDDIYLEIIISKYQFCS